MQDIYKNNFIIITLLIIVALSGCHRSNDKTAIFQKKRNRAVDFEDEIIDLPDMLPVNYCAEIKIINDLLFIKDVNANHKGLYVYNKSNFKYITSTGYIGKGPGEIGVFGAIVPMVHRNAFLMTDFAKRIIYRFDIDSILNDSIYKPIKVSNLDRIKPEIGSDYNFCWRMKSINDTMFLAVGVMIRKNSIYAQFLAKYNILTKDIEKVSFNPSTSVEDIKKGTLIFYDLSLKDKLITKSYANSDLITILNLKGDVLYNIYGPEWGKNTNGKKTYFGPISITDKYIIASYTGENTFFFDEFKRPHFSWPKKFIVFDLNGKYITTIDTKHRMTAWCVDEKNKRIIAYFDDRDVEFGYFNIDFLDKL